MADSAEIREKERRIRELMDKQELDALAISTIANFAWLTCGGSNYVGITTEVGAALALITRNAKYIISENIEAPRLRDEERLADQGYELISFDWYEGKRDEIIRDIVGNGRLGADTGMAGAKNISSVLEPCRYSLTPAEIDRYEKLGKDAGECLLQASMEVEPGMTEHQAAGIMNDYLIARGVVPGVTLIAADERIEKYRHPLPTSKKIERYVMLVTGARRFGLIVSCTRLVHFGPLPQELRRKHDAVMQVDAAFITGTRVGTRMGDIFGHAQNVYAQTEFADEWRLHHQGGSTGYRGRDIRVNSGTDAVVVENQAFAWNPSITGTKSEDTFIVTSDGQKVISLIPDWPAVEIETGDILISRPDIMIR